MYMQLCIEQNYNYIILEMKQNTNSTTVKSNSIMNSVSVQIIRCGCTEEQKSHPDWHGNNTKTRSSFPCSNPKRVENKGIVAFWHKNPIKRFIFWFKTKILNSIIKN